MAGNNKHVVFKDGAWKIKGEGSQRSSGNFKTQREAIERAREIAINQRCEVRMLRTEEAVHLVFPFFVGRFSSIRSCAISGSGNPARYV